MIAKTDGATNSPKALLGCSNCVVISRREQFWNAWARYFAAAQEISSPITLIATQINPRAITGVIATVTFNYVGVNRPRKGLRIICVIAKIG